MVSFTRSARASMPSVPSTTRAMSRIHSARTVSPSKIAITASSASTVPLAV